MAGGLLDEGCFQPLASTYQRSTSPSGSSYVGSFALKDSTIEPVSWGGRKQTNDPLVWVIVLSSTIILHVGEFAVASPPSSRGLGHLPFTEATGIRIPLGVSKKVRGVKLLTFRFFSPVDGFLVG